MMSSITSLLNLYKLACGAKGFSSAPSSVFPLRSPDITPAPTAQCPSASNLAPKREIEPEFEELFFTVMVSRRDSQELVTLCTGPVTEASKCDSAPPGQPNVNFQCGSFGLSLVLHISCRAICLPNRPLMEVPKALRGIDDKHRALQSGEK
jgi:hypothetical protein